MKTSASVLSLAVGLSLAACGGGSTDHVRDGTISDGPVSGLKFSTPSINGVTDAAGTFRYGSSETVRFFAGSILIGTAKGAPALHLFHLDGGLAGDGNPSTRSRNIAWFLQNLDQDGNPDNGIVLTPVVQAALEGKSADFEAANPAVESDALYKLVTQVRSADGNTSALRSVDDALTHARDYHQRHFGGMTVVPPGGAAGGLVASVTQYVVDIPTSLNPVYNGPFAGNFPEGFPLGIGSGLRLKEIRSDGSLSFYTLTDRGPNGDSPAYRAPGSSQAQASKVFPVPSFVPQFGLINVSGGLASYTESTGMLDSINRAISGRPLPEGSTGATGEMVLDDQLLASLSFDDRGLDPEGIDVDHDGMLWVADEYGPFIAQVHPSTGEVVRKFVPGAATDSLPALLAKRTANRGFEGLAIAPNGRIYAALQSTLDSRDASGNPTKDKTPFIRILELNPNTGATRQFAYPLTAGDYKKYGAAKIGDLVAIDNNRFALIEQGSFADGRVRNWVVRIDLSGATDISTLGELESSVTTLAQLSAKGVTPVTKTKLFDLTELGWEVEKAEGLALVGSDTLAVINDNDFGLSASMLGGSESDPTAYEVDADGRLSLDGVSATGVSYHLGLNSEVERSTRLWLIKLKQPL